jgi:hypothetical protein
MSHTVVNNRLCEATKLRLGKLGYIDIHQIAAGSFANLPPFRVLGNPALARAVDGDGTSRLPAIEAHLCRELGSDA